MKKKQHSFSRNARDFGFLARAFGLDEVRAMEAWEMRETDGEYVPDRLPSSLTFNGAKQTCLEYEEKIRTEASKLEHVDAYDVATILGSKFFQAYILRNSGRILPKLVALNIL